MATILGALNLNDTDRVFEQVGQRAVYDLVADYVNRYNAEVDSLVSIFVDGSTDLHTMRYKLPGSGGGQDMGFAPQARPPVVKTIGDYDVALPLTSWQVGIAGDRVTMAYMTVADMDRHISSAIVGNTNDMRRKILNAIFDNTTDTFIDPLNGTLTIQPLANGDSVLYPPTIGSVSESTQTHYAESGYAASAVSDTNNPYKVIEAHLTEHFGKSMGNDNVAVFINSAQRAVTEDLTDFVEVTDRFVVPGTQTSRLTGLPTGHPGRVIGRVSGCWVIEWDHIPANYMLGIHLDAPGPLMRRIDPAGTGLSSGLTLVYEDDELPFEYSYWERRDGYGAGNRLNGFVMELGTGGTYTVPTF